MQISLKSFFIFLKKIIFIFSISFCTHAEVIIGSLNAESGQISDIAGIIIEAQRVAVEYINSDNIGIQGQGLIELQRS